MSAVVLQEMPLDTQAVNSECKGFIFTTAREKGRGKCWFWDGNYGRRNNYWWHKERKREEGGKGRERQKTKRWREGRKKQETVVPHSSHPSVHPFPPSALPPSGICPFLSLLIQPPPILFLLLLLCLFFFCFLWACGWNSTSVRLSLTLSPSLCQSVCAVMWQVRDMYRGIRKCDCIERQV